MNEIGASEDEARKTFQVFDTQDVEKKLNEAPHTNCCRLSKLLLQLQQMLVEWRNTCTNMEMGMAFRISKLKIAF